MFIAMVLENANIPIPSEIVLGFAGYLIAQGIFDLHTTIGCRYFSRDCRLYLILLDGLSMADVHFLLKYGKYIFFNEHKFELAEKMFNKYGGCGRILWSPFTWCSYLHFFPSRSWRVIQCGTSLFGQFLVRFLGRFCSFT